MCSAVGSEVVGVDVDPHRDGQARVGVVIQGPEDEGIEPAVAVEIGRAGGAGGVVAVGALVAQGLGARPVLYLRENLVLDFPGE